MTARTDHALHCSELCGLRLHQTERWRKARSVLAEPCDRHSTNCLAACECHLLNQHIGDRMRERKTRGCSRKRA